MEVAIDTSTGIASLALAGDGNIIAELTWCCRQNHTVEVLPRLTQLLEGAKLDIKSATAVIVAVGPGSFNGLRVGVSAAKGLAFSLSIPLVGVGTLDVAAYQHAATGLPVCAVFDAGRQEIATATFQMVDGSWQRLVAEHITTVESLCHAITSQTVFCGEFAPVVERTLAERLPGLAVLPSYAARLRRAGFLVELGRQRLMAGKTDDPATLQPIYLRRPPITVSKRQYGGIT